MKESISKHLVVEDTIEEGQCNNPCGIHVGKHDSILVCDSDNSRLQAFISNL